MGWHACFEVRVSVHDDGSSVVSRIYSTSLLIILQHSVLQYFLLYIELLRSVTLTPFF